jgi:hypothetical protein
MSAWERSLIAGAPKRSRSHSKRRSCLVKTIENRSREPVGFEVAQSVGRRPKEKGMARRPNLTQANIDRLRDLGTVQDFREWAGIDMQKEPPHSEGRGLRVAPRRTVGVDGPTLHTFMFGNSK